MSTRKIEYKIIVIDNSEHLFIANVDFYKYPVSIDPRTMCHRQL